MDTNATRFKEGTYIWQLEDGKLTGIYALNNKSYAGLIVAIIGIIVFVSGIYIILKNPFNKEKKSERIRGMIMIIMAIKMMTIITIED